MIPAEVIKLKRDGVELSPQMIGEFVSGFVSNKVADYQMSAFLMAVFLNGMTKKETWALTEAMLHSGEVVDFSFIKGAKIDKHSTGGVGDKTSMILGPIAAAAGVKVPMISGRGLGHSGGTLDKLESIPGFSTQQTLDDFKNQVAVLGLCYIGQTKEICPADKRMYALRDVTGTVECIPLICGSIMSKKLAEGIDGLVLDVKTGSGAFMKTSGEAKKLAQALVDIGRNGKKQVTALITDMSQPLGATVGCALEIEECLEVLNNMGPPDVRELSLELAAHMILMAGIKKNLRTARECALEMLTSGRALSLFIEVVKAQGGHLDLPQAEMKKEVLSPKKGFINSMNTEKIGLSALSLGAGRRRVDDQVDLAAGIRLHKKIGDPVEKGESLATLYYSPSTDPTEASQLYLGAVEIRSQKKKSPRLIQSVISTRPIK